MVNKTDTALPLWSEKSVDEKERQWSSYKAARAAGAPRVAPWERGREGPRVRGVNAGLGEGARYTETREGWGGAEATDRQGQAFEPWSGGSIHPEGTSSPC